MNRFVPAVKTVVTEHDIITAIKQSYSTLFDVDISLDTLAILCAHVFLECGRGKACFNFNLGNVKQTKEHTWTMYKCSEILNGKEVFFSPPHPQTHFNAYESLPDAALEHLRFLELPRYEKALDAANRGEPEEYVDELKAAGYFTAGLEKYKKAVVSLYKEILTKYADEVDDSGDSGGNSDIKQSTHS